MAEPQNNPSLLDHMSRLRGRRNTIPRQQVEWEPDAVNETLTANGAPQRLEAARRNVEFRQLLQLRELQAQTARRNDYRARKKAERTQAQQLGLQIFSVPAEFMSDEAVDAAIAQEQREALLRASQPQIRSTDPVWNYPAETRRALGYYTNEEREQAARLNDMRSSTFLRNVMPNFGRQAAYNNPGAEMDAYRQTALYMPNAVVAGSGFGLPSATTATASGLRTGWETARAAGANIGQGVMQATATAARLAAPIITNPRWAATTASVVAPMAAAASDGSELSGGFWNWVGEHPAESILAGALLYKGGRGLWNKSAGKLRIPAEPVEGRPAEFTEAAPERGTSRWTYNPADYPAPVMRREPVLDDSYRITVELPLQPRPAAFTEPEPTRPTGLRPRKRSRAAQWDTQNLAHQEWEARKALYEAENAELNRQWDAYEQAQNGPARYDEARFQADHDNWERTAQADHEAAMRAYEADKRSYRAEQSRLTREYNKAVTEYNLRKAANLLAWNAYHESEPYKQWLKRKNEATDFRNKAWSRVKNNFYWTIPAGIVGYKWISGGYSDNPNNENNPNGDSSTPTDLTATLPAGFKPILGINDFGQLVTQSSSGKPDSVINVEKFENRFSGK